MTYYYTTSEGQRVAGSRVSGVVRWHTCRQQFLAIPVQELRTSPVNTSRAEAHRNASGGRWFEHHWLKCKLKFLSEFDRSLGEMRDRCSKDAKQVIGNNLFFHLLQGKHLMTIQGDEHLLMSHSSGKAGELRHVLSTEPLDELP